MVGILMGASEDQWAEVSGSHNKASHFPDSLYYTDG